MCCDFFITLRADLEAKAIPILHRGGECTGSTCLHTALILFRQQRLKSSHRKQGKRGGRIPARCASLSRAFLFSVLMLLVATNSHRRRCRFRCRQRINQGYIRCNSCQAWLHYECAGTTAESAADVDSFTCRDCSASSSKKSSKRKAASSSSSSAAAVGDQQQHRRQHNREDSDVPTPNPKRSKTGNPGKSKSSKGAGVIGNAGAGSSGKSGKATPRKGGGGSVGVGVGVGGAAVGWQGGAVRGDPAPWAKLEAGWKRLEPQQIRCVSGLSGVWGGERHSFEIPRGLRLVYARPCLFVGRVG